MPNNTFRLVCAKEGRDAITQLQVTEEETQEEMRRRDDYQNTKDQNFIKRPRLPEIIP
jgi:hypothetical protein